MIRFLQPEWFWALTVLPLVVLWRGRRGPVAAVEYSDVSLARDVARRTRSRIGGIVWLLPIIAAALMIVGLARPQRTHSRTEVTANGIDIVLGLDISGSMQALDFMVDNYRVNRIAVVKSVVSKFIDERPNDRIGLIAFAAAPYIVSPLTLDHDWLQQNLERVNVGIGDDGTAIGSAIAAAVNHLRTTTAKSKVVILLTDGVNNSGKISPLAAAEAARALGVKVYTIGVGVRGKAPIPVRDETGKIHVIMAEVDVDEKTLQAVANETGGQFYRATDTDSLQKIYEQINRYETSAQTVQKFEHVEELYRWTLFPSLGLLATRGALAADEVSQVTVRFSDPHWLLAGLLTCLVLIGIWRRYDVRQHAALAQFVAPHLRRRLTGSVSGIRRFLQRGLFLGSALCLCAALAGPLLGYHWEKISRRGNEVVFAIDTSRSMLTPDVKPNRLTRAKLAIDDMARQLDGDGIGIVAFAGSAFLVCPLTLDYGAFHQSLDADRCSHHSARRDQHPERHSGGARGASPPSGKRQNPDIGNGWRESRRGRPDRGQRGGEAGWPEDLHGRHRYRGGRSDPLTVGSGRRLRQG